MDNTTAECFTNTAFKSRLKHIDTRQHWVKVLRDKNILIPQHIDAKDNLADFFPKILSKETFQKLFHQLMSFIYQIAIADRVSAEEASLNAASTVERLDVRCRPVPCVGRFRLMAASPSKLSMI